MKIRFWHIFVKRKHGSVIKRRTYFEHYDWTDEYYHCTHEYYEWRNEYYEWVNQYYEWEKSITSDQASNTIT